MAFGPNRGQILNIGQASEVDTSTQDLGVPELLAQGKQWARLMGLPVDPDPRPEFVVVIATGVSPHGIEALSF